MTGLDTIELENHAIVIVEQGKLAVQARPLTLAGNSGNPIVPSGNVLIAVKVTGICGSDIHAWKNSNAESPYVIGHECSGTIIAVGPDVTRWKLQDRVAILPGRSCNRCDDCTTGATNLCANGQYFGIPGSDGSGMTMKVIPESQLVPLTPRISWVEAGLIQPLAVCIQLSRQVGNFMHKNVIVFGAGCIGLLTARLAQIYGANSVVMVEKDKHRANFARRFLRVQSFVNPIRDATESMELYCQRFSDHILDHISDLERGFDIVVEASGAEECMNMGLRVARPNGIFIQVGLYSGDHPQISMFEVLRKQLTIRGKQSTLRYTTNCFEQAIALIDEGKVRVKDTVSHTYHLRDATKAFEAVHKREDEEGKKCLKVVILHDEEDMFKSSTSLARQAKM